MGASCATGSKTTDPDKEPYGPSEKKKKKEKEKEPERAEVDPVEKNPAEENKSGGEVKADSQRRPPPPNREEPDDGRKISDSSRLRGSRDEERQPKRPSRGSSTEGVSSRPQSAEKKRDSREVPDDVAHGKTATAGEQPRPRKRTSKEDKHSVETKNAVEGTQPEPPEPAPRRKRDDDGGGGGGGRTRRQSAEKRTPEVTSSGPDETTTTTRQSEAMKREGKRSSLDNEFVVPVKVETKAKDVSNRDNEAEPRERVDKFMDNLSKEEFSRSPPRSSQKPDLVGDSVVKLKPEPKRRSTEADGKTGPERQKNETPGQNSLFTFEPSAPCGVRDEDRGGGQSQVDGRKQSEIQGRESKSKEIKVEEIKIEEHVTRSSVPTEIPKHEDVTIVQKETASPRRKTVPDEYEVPPSGLTPRAANDVTNPTFSISRSLVKDTDEKPKSGSRQIPSPTKQPGDGSMAIFDALRGLKAQKPGPDAVPTAPGKEEDAVHSSTVNTNFSTSVSNQQTPTTPPQSASSTQSSPAKDAAEQWPIKLQTSNESAPSKQVPDTSTIKHEGNISTNGIESQINENELKSKPDRNSRLPVKGSTTSPTTSPLISTSDSSSTSPISPTPSSPSSLSTKLSDSTQRKDSMFAKNLREIEKTKTLLINLSEENKSLIDSHTFHPNTRSKLIQAIDKWFTMTEKERENTSRVMVVSGLPGIGKTGLSTELCRRYSSQLIGQHFFQFQPHRLDQNFAKTMVLSIAAKLTEALPDYSDFLPTFRDLRQLLDEDELFNIFNALITRPLQNLSTEKRYLIVVDALDECCQSDRDHLLQLINGFDKKTPDCVYLFCTIRDDNQLTGQMERLQLIELKGTSDAMTSDIKRFLRDPMSRLIDRISLDGALTQLSLHSQGTFLAAYLLKKKLESYPDGSKLALRDVTLFPSGFGDMCKEYCQRFYDHLSKKYTVKETTAVYSGIVGILAVAKDKLNPSFVRQVHVGLDPETDLGPLRGLLDVDDTGAVGLHHKSISEWLLSDQTAAPLTVAPANARQKMSEAVLVWLTSVLELSASNSSPPVLIELQNYALKHALEHFTDVPKNQDSIAGLLCSLVFIEKKLQLPGVTIEDLVNDYNHHHYQVTGASSKLVTLEAYMKKFTDLAQQIEAYSMFVRRKGDQISRYPSLVLQFAANYPTVPRIQHNAQNDLLEKPWLEDVTANAESPSMRRQVTGIICQSDLSNDGRSVAILTHDEQTVLLYLLNVATGEYIGEPADISNITDRKGLCLRFMPDGNHLFVGSLSTFMSLKTWKPITSTIDSQSLQLKENFAIECCDAAGSTLACGISTLPWNGRSLYLGIYDMKTKKAKTIEVHSFRFGGSSQFGIKALALSQDGGLVCTCVKHQKKVELKVTVWNTGTSKQLHTVDLENDALTRCYFVGNQSLLVSGGFETPKNLQLSYFWSFQDKKAKLLPNGNADNTSIAYARGTQLAMVHHYQSSSQFIVSRWRKEAAKHENPDDRFVVCGLEKLGDMIATEKSLTFLSRKLIQIYQYADLTAEETKLTTGSFALHNSVVESIGFYPRSDDPIIVHRSSTAFGDGEDGLSTTVSVSRVSVKTDRTLFGRELFTSEKLEHRSKRNEASQFRCFQGEQTTSNVCSCTSDGAMVVINTGCSATVLDVSSGTKWSLPNITELQKQLILEQRTSVSKITCALSSKEPLLGILYSEKPDSLFIFDLRSKATEPILELKLDVETSIDDFAFIPNNGNIITYHRTSEQTALIVWNHRSGVVVSRQIGVDVIYVRQSPSSDRLVMSLRVTNGNDAGSLVLRNSDNQFNISLALPKQPTWSADVGCGDVEFSGDGTVLLGLFVEAQVVRLWNIGNGEVLKDLQYGFIGSTSDLVGMLTNTHALVSDGRMLHVFNVDSGDILAIHHSSDRFCTKQSSKGLRVSPKGGLIAGSTQSGAELRLFQSHGLTAVKRKTTLQLIRNK